ncbi:Na+/H+ antiporter subunit E [Phaeacidiphilus oryzae]|uniref:Na+/H+ antiporter subunit E n=1 Tax=Phaeacidiphilus oryzae TaxID=348818 RepID=UPI00055B6E49|nr:Na+/H+ antiporter subunit E [Phaeacidiphilus oryzae]
MRRNAIRESLPTALWALALWGLYAVLISTVDPFEAAVGVGGTALAVWAGRAAVRASRVRAGAPAGALRAAAVWPGTVLAETGRLAAAVLRPGRRRGSGFRSTPPGPGRAWAALLLSATPGTLVVAVDERDGARAHALFSHEDGEQSRLERELTTDPGAGPRERS